MKTTRPRIASDIKLFPVPGRPADPRYPGLATMSREIFLREVLLARLTDGSTRKLTPAGLAAKDEWIARWNFAHFELAKKDAAAHNDEVQLKLDIVESLVQERRAYHVAVNLINTEAKMLAEGRRLGII